MKDNIMRKIHLAMVLGSALAIGIAGVEFFEVSAGAAGRPKMPTLPRLTGETVQTPLPAKLNTTHSESGNEGVSVLTSINQSGIQALVSIQKVGRTETVTGFATGMDPYKAYVSLFYDAEAQGSGPCACTPSNPPPAPQAATCQTTDASAINFNQMMIGYWLPLIGSSTRTLQVLKAGGADAAVGAAFVEFEKIGAISVREDTQLGTSLPSAPDPARFPLRACGQIRFRK